VARFIANQLLGLNQRYFYPKDAAKSCFHRQRDWKVLPTQRAPELSYGHNVEFAWLMRD